MIKGIYNILDKHQKSRMVILLFMILGGAVLETVGVSAVLPLVSAVTDPSIIETNKLYNRIFKLLNLDSSEQFILLMAILLIIVYIFKNLYLIALNSVQNHFVTNNQRRLATRLVNCYMTQEYLFHVEHNVAELQRNVEYDINNFMHVLTNVLQLITECLVCGMLLFFLFITDPYTTMLLVILMAVFMLIFVKGVKKRLKVLGRQTRDFTANKTKFFLEAFGGIKEIKTSSKEEYFVNRYDRASKDYALAAQKQMLLTYIPKPIMETLLICGLLLFMAIRIVMGADVSRFIPIMSVFAVAAIRMLPSFNRISGNLNVLMFNRASVDEVSKDLAQMHELDVIHCDHSCECEIPLDKVVCKNVRFSYPETPDKYVLDGINIEIPVNKSVAFVGPSGSGKTTLADIILGVLKPIDGTVKVGNVDIFENIRSWHERVGYIPQSIFLTDGTVRSNVAFGIPENEIDDVKVWRALEEAQIADFFRNQKDGINSLIGDRGVKISGGQRQRIGIARALYSDPSVIVLDEATSALDNDTERAVMDAIYQLSGKKTMIIIAHRLSTISECDIIYEIKDGVATKREYYDLISG